MSSIDPDVRFPAFVFTNDGDASSRGVREVGLAEIAPDGVLIASGFEGHEVDDVAAAFATAGGHVDAISAEHTWRAVRLSRRLVPALAEV